MRLNPLAALILANAIVFAGDTCVVPDTLSIEKACLLAAECNPKIKSALYAIKEQRGRAIASWSRLLPQVNLLFRNGWLGMMDTAAPGNKLDEPRNQSISLEVRQRIVEFGATNEEEFNRIMDQRHASFGYENQLAQTFSDLRNTYYSLAIIRNQRAQHDSLLVYYQDKLRNAQSRLESGVGYKNDVLTVRSNILDERGSILSLREQEKDKLANLKELLGVNRLPARLSVLGLPAPIEVSEDSCVLLTMETHYDIADKRLEADIARRKLLEKGWNLFPDIKMSVGIAKGDRSASIEAGSNRADSRHTWAIDAVGTQKLATPDTAPSNFGVGGDNLFPAIDPNLRYTAALAVDLPLFRGLRNLGEGLEAGAAYMRSRSDLLSKTAEIERQVRMAFIQYANSIERLTMQKERVEIAQERYELAEAQRELGKISEYEFEGFRLSLFQAREAYFRQQFETLGAGENLRKLVRRF